MHWGITPLITAPRLEIPPWVFLAFVLLSRLLLDAHLRTSLRPRLELGWARKEALISTRQLMKVCMGMFLLENLGVKIITYIKPIMVLMFFGVSSTGFLAIAAYNVAVKNSTR